MEDCREDSGDGGHGVMWTTGRGASVYAEVDELKIR
jgi:hypothetical protein